MEGTTPKCAGTAPPTFPPTPPPFTPTRIAGLPCLPVIPTAPLPFKVAAVCERCKLVWSTEVANAGGRVCGRCVFETEELPDLVMNARRKASEVVAMGLMAEQPDIHRVVLQAVLGATSQVCSDTLRMGIRLPGRPTAVQILPVPTPVPEASQHATSPLERDPWQGWTARFAPGTNRDRSRNPIHQPTTPTVPTPASSRVKEEPGQDSDREQQKTGEDEPGLKACEQSET